MSNLYTKMRHLAANLNTMPIRTCFSELKTEDLVTILDGYLASRQLGAVEEETPNKEDIDVSKDH